MQFTVYQSRRSERLCDDGGGAGRGLYLELTLHELQLHEGGLGTVALSGQGLSPGLGRCLGRLQGAFQHCLQIEE